MFSKNLQRPTLVSPAADHYFKDFPYDGSFSRDYSMVATIRAVIAPRVSEGQGVRMTFKDVRPSMRDMEGNVAELFRTQFGDMSDCDRFYLINLTSGSEENERFCKILDESFVAVHPKFHECADIRKFTSQCMDARFYINEEDHVTMIVVVRMTLSRYHLLQAIMPRFFPWYFKDKPMDDDERDLFRAASKRTGDDFEAILEKISTKRFDMRTLTIKALITDFEKKSRQTQLEEAKRQLERINEEIRENNERHRTLIRNRDDKIIRYEGVRTLINGASDGSELLDYCISNKNLELVSTQDSEISFILRGYLSIFDPEVYECSARNFDSILYNGYQVGASAFSRREDRKLFLDAIFGDNPKLQIRTCAHFELDIRGSVSATSGYHYPSKYDDCLPNPHLNFFSCLGNQERYIRQALEHGEVSDAITQCGSSVASINVGEPPTMERFLKEIFSSTTHKFIELPDGSNVTPADALAWLKSQSA